MAEGGCGSEDQGRLILQGQYAECRIRKQTLMTPETPPPGALKLADTSSSLLNQAYMFRVMHRHPDAIAAYDELIRRFGDSTEAETLERIAKAFYNKAATLEQLKRGTKAVAVYSELANRIDEAAGASLRKQIAQAMLDNDQPRERVVRFAQRMLLWLRTGAQFHMGLMYDTGRLIGQSPAEAVKWYRLAAEQGHATAQSKLGFMYYDGQGVPQDYGEAIRWYRLAAAPGDTPAPSGPGTEDTQVADVVRDHPGARKTHPHDYGDAREEYRPAKGDTQAQANLGFMYCKGQGVDQDYGEAIRWFRMAAAQGDAGAQSNLGYMYAQGYGVPQDYGRAYMWFSIGAATGSAHAVKQRDAVAGELTPQQIAHAQAMAQECRQRNFRDCDY